jgi:hypothetical protein
MPTSSGSVVKNLRILMRTFLSEALESPQRTWSDVSVNHYLNARRPYKTKAQAESTTQAPRRSATNHTRLVFEFRWLVLITGEITYDKRDFVHRARHGSLVFVNRNIRGCSRSGDGSWFTHSPFLNQSCGNITKSFKKKSTEVKLMNKSKSSKAYPKRLSYCYAVRDK